MKPRPVLAGVGQSVVGRTAFHHLTVTGLELAGNTGNGTAYFTGDVLPAATPFISPLPGKAQNVTTFDVSFRYLANVTTRFRVDGVNPAFNETAPGSWPWACRWSVAARCSSAARAP